MVYFETDSEFRYRKKAKVSILVLMDGVLRDKNAERFWKVHRVSILVLMDGVLRATRPRRKIACTKSFNPCSNGWCTSSLRHCAPSARRCSVSILVLMDGVLRELVGIHKKPYLSSFNPCSNGWCTSRFLTKPHFRAGWCFNPCSNGWCTSSLSFIRRAGDLTLCFNPCSNGWCTSRGQQHRQYVCDDSVSILVLMDGVLRG